MAHMKIYWLTIKRSVQTTVGLEIEAERMSNARFSEFAPFA